MLGDGATHTGQQVLWLWASAVPCALRMESTAVVP